jgi:hypothetical protein
MVKLGSVKFNNRKGVLHEKRITNNKDFNTEGDDNLTLHNNGGKRFEFSIKDIFILLQTVFRIVNC